MATTTTVDPACGMTVNPETAAARREVDGVTYYFCSSRCAATFDADPARHTAPSAKQDPHRGARHHAQRRTRRFAAVICDIDGVVTNTAGLHAAAAAKCGWHEGIHLGGAETMTTTSDH
jgi:YHS domain-containing protein